MSLLSADDLLAIHGVDYKMVDGFNTLSEENKAVFKSFIVTFYNAQGLRGKSTLVPEKIAYVKERYWSGTVLNTDGSSSWDILKEEQQVIDARGNNLQVIFSKIDERYDDSLPNIIEKQIFYLRFDYKIYDKPAWVHVAQDSGWW